MNYWDSVGRWINTLLLFIVGVIAFDTLFRLLEAQDGNLIVGVVRVLTALVLVPFQGMFSEQEYVLTALMGVLGYTLLVGIALAVLRSLQATRPPRPPVYEPQPRQRPTSESERGRTPGVAQPARSADAAQSKAAQRATARRTTKRQDPPPVRTPAAKPPTRTQPVQQPAATPRPRPEGANRNGRQPTSETAGEASRQADPVASRTDGVGSRPAESVANRADGAASRPADTTDKSPDKATTTSTAARATDTASPRETKPSDRDRSND